MLSQDSRPFKYLWFFAFLGILARLVLSVVSVGTSDALHWRESAQIIAEHGLLFLYSSDPQFNNPPLISVWNSLLWHLSGPDQVFFPFLLRLPGILCETASLYLIYDIVRRKKVSVAPAMAVLFFAWNPISILISGYHGHMDSLCAGLVFFAIYAAEKKRHASAGLLLGLAINVKLIPLLLLPVFIGFYASSWRDMKRFLAGLLPAALPFLPPLLLCGHDFVDHVLAYNSVREYWGVRMFLMLLQASHPGSAFWGGLDAFYASSARFLILAIVAVFGFRVWKGKCDLIEGTLLSLSAFIVLSPGFGVQYYAFLPALLCCTDLKWARRISVLAAFHACASYAYFMKSWFPLMSLHFRTSPKLIMFIGFLAWLSVLVFLFERLLAPRAEERKVS